MEARLNSTLETEFDFNFSSFSGNTISSADITAGTSTCTPSKSSRNKSAEFNRMLANVSPHSRVCKSTKNRKKKLYRDRDIDNLRLPR